MTHLPDRVPHVAPGIALDPFQPVFDFAEGEELDDVPGATHWPELTADDAEEAWEELRDWVEQLQQRFAHLDHHVIPRCWWQHNEHVEALSALRDHELASFDQTAPATAPAEWCRALRDVEALLRSWTGEVSCGANHNLASVQPTQPAAEDWRAFVAEDIARRRQHEMDDA